VCLYQGEELGLPEADVPYEALQDPYGKTFWPNFKGRDGCRTPMPWDDSAQAGFSDGKPWLPIPADHIARNVAAQDADPHSVLNAARAFLRWRRTQPALREGAIQFLDTSEPVLAFVRECESQRLLVAFNLSGAAIDMPLPAGLRVQAITAPGVANGRTGSDVLQLPAHGAFYATLD
jgi:alpha-glucosidase